MLCGCNRREEMRRRRLEVGGIGLCVALVAAGIAHAADRTAIAIFREWGAFREGTADAPTRCFAIAEPPPNTLSAGHGAFASVANWPAKRVRAQLAMRLSHPLRPDMPVTLTIGDASFPLVAQGQNAWAHDRHQDARIVAAMRSGSSMSVSAVGANGNPFADVYRLRGAASAIDAASLACPMR
jgi:hypothetical protein